MEIYWNTSDEAVFEQKKETQSAFVTLILMRKSRRYAVIEAVFEQIKENPVRLRHADFDKAIKEIRGSRQFFEAYDPQG